MLYIIAMLTRTVTLNKACLLLLSLTEFIHSLTINLCFNSLICRMGGSNIFNILIESSSYIPQENIVLAFNFNLILKANHGGSYMFDLFPMQHTGNMDTQFSLCYSSPGDAGLETLEQTYFECQRKVDMNGTE